MITAAGFEKAWKYIDLFEQGLLCTVSLSVLTVLFGFLLALVLTAMRFGGLCLFPLLPVERQRSLLERGGPLLSLSRFDPVRLLSVVYVEVFRATPMLVQLFLVYHLAFGEVRLPKWKLFGFIRFERFLPGVAALALNSGAYLSEIIRSGLQSIDPGQREAARSLGLSRIQTMRFVVLPQAIRNILPAIGNEFVTIIKESSICYTIGVQEIMYAVNTVSGATYSIAEPLIIATAVYFCLTFPTSKLIAWCERRMGRESAGGGAAGRQEASS